MTTQCIQKNFLLSSDSQAFTTANVALTQLTLAGGLILTDEQVDNINNAIDDFLTNRSAKAVPQAVTTDDIWDLVFHRLYPIAVRQAFNQNMEFEMDRSSRTQDGTEVICYTITLTPRPVEAEPLPPIEDVINDIPPNPFPNPADSPNDPNQFQPSPSQRQPSPPTPTDTRQPQQPLPRLPLPDDTPQAGTPRVPIPTNGGTRGPIIISLPPEAPREAQPEGEEEEQPEGEEEQPEGEEEEAEPLPDSDEFLDLLRQIRDEVRSQGEQTRELELQTAGAIIEGVQNTLLQSSQVEQALLDGIRTDINNLNLSVDESITEQTEALTEAIQSLSGGEPDESGFTQIADAIDRLTGGVTGALGEFTIEGLQEIDLTLSRIVGSIDNGATAVGDVIREMQSLWREQFQEDFEEARDNLINAFAFDIDDIATQLCKMLEFVRKLAEVCEIIREARK